eukprot:CAMPEP_0114690718 /NCGR_PEP_ID=MMETSP0191-20121206/65997_1 /TAXON_ID=126664 /ORGANISM="Sorites sp." /LENGTH=128 /DNA_ID=CAMNT_0001980959 /DNA_START=397 /DNA_END=783 /DNA_ORIENTATION=-
MMDLDLEKVKLNPFIDNYLKTICGSGGYGTKGSCKWGLVSFDDVGLQHPKVYTSTTYGNKSLDVLYLGSGGSGGEYDYGCNGGGAIKIIANNIYIDDKSGIYCNGNKVNTECGCGSGGSVVVVVQYIL